jgi:hypothetical protein
VSEREDLFAYYAGQDEGQRLFRLPTIASSCCARASCCCVSCHCLRPWCLTWVAAPV